jgi:O-methyltransferase involved in polyketide biosynthesis
MKAESASLTAKVIAASTLLLFHSDGDRLVPKRATELCALFLSTTPADRLLAWSAHSPLSRWLWWLAERLTLPGIVRHYWYSKTLIERECQRGLEEGYRQVVILGAGFDALVMRPFSI